MRYFLTESMFKQVIKLSKIVSFEVFLKTSMDTDCFIYNDRLFHNIGPIVQKLLSLNFVFSLNSISYLIPGSLADLNPCLQLSLSDNNSMK